MGLRKLSEAPQSTVRIDFYSELEIAVVGDPLVDIRNRWGFMPKPSGYPFKFLGIAWHVELVVHSRQKTGFAHENPRKACERLAALVLKSCDFRARSGKVYVAYAAKNETLHWPPPMMVSQTGYLSRCSVLLDLTQVYGKPSAKVS